MLGLYYRTSLWLPSRRIDDHVDKKELRDHAVSDTDWEKLFPL